MLRKVRALSRKWFSKARRAARRAVRGKSKSIRTTSAVGNKRPYTSEPYNARSGTRTSPSNQVGEGFDLSRPTNESALEQLSRGAISTFGSDIQSLLSEGKDVLKSLHGDFFSEKGYEAGEASRSVFKTFYDMPSGTYTGLNRSQAWGEDEDAFSYSLRQRTTEIVDVLVSKDTLPATQLQTRMSRLNRETRTLSQKGTFGTLGDPYIRRPGVGLIVDVIDQAEREIVIDLYQLQNRTVLDALEQKVRDTPGIKVSVRLSLPDEGTQGQKGFDILGPNLLSLERLRRVKEALGERGDIELFVQDRKSHQKVMVTDKFGVIGSLNLTAPVGNDVNQAGSNYEVVRRLQTREYSEEQYRNQGMTPTREEEVLISSSDKLFKQLQTSVGNRDALRKDPTEQLRLNQGQIVGSAETYEHLRETLDMMRSPSDKKFYGILNQVFLLYHEDTMFNEMLHGEMGKFDSPNTVRGPIMKGIQTELLDLVIGNRAFLAIDNRNYSEHVLTPMYERTEAIFKGTGLPINSLEELVSRVGYDVSNPVKSFMRRVEAVTGSTLAEGFNESYARQLLAMTSGNIRLTTVPMQHSKQYLVTESIINGSSQAAVGDLDEARSFYSGSSNLGPFSMHAPEFNTSPQEIERTNREIGLALIQGKARTGPHSLSQEELNAELELARQSFSKDWGTLTRTELGRVQGRPTSAWYEDKVDKVRLGELHARLTELTTTLGVGEVSYKYGGKSGTERIGLSLSMDARQLAGFGEGFERVQGNGPRFRWDYTTLAGGMGGDEGYVLDITKGRVISRSLIHNSSAASLNIRVEDISHGIGQDVLLGRAEALNKKFVTVAPNKAAVMNPIGTTLSLVSTLLLESTNRLLVWGPEQYLSHLSGGERRTLVQKYLDSFTPTGDLIQQAGESDRSSITNLSDTLARRLRGDVDGALQKARAWTGQEVRGKGVSNELGGIIDNVQHLLSSMSYGYTASEYEQYKLEGKSDVETRASVPLSDGDLSKARIERAGSYSSDIVDMLLPLLDTSADFRLAVVQTTVAQSNASYMEILSSGINKMSGAMMEPFLLSAQVSQYSGAQGWFRLPMYSATNEYQEVLQNLEGTPFHSLATRAVAIPRAISPYSSIGTPGLHRNVAGGTNNEGTSTDTGITLFGQRGTAVDTIMHHRVTSSMGVGFSTTREDILSSTLSDKAKVRALAVFDEQGSDELLTYMFGGKGKVAQIPQRLKNTQGQRGMGKLTQALTTAMDGTGLDFLASAREYGRDIGQRLREKLVRKNPTWTPHQVEQYIDRIMPEQDVVLSASFAMSVRGVMSGEQVAIMEAYESSLMELGLDIEDFNEGGIGHELVRMRAISSDVMSTGMKGFTSSPSFALVQMAGMYSDYFYANPDASPMEGNLRTTTKKVKASMLGVAWTRADAGGQELASARDVVMFDESLQKVIVVNHITGAVTNHELSSLTEGDILALPKEVIDDRGQRHVLEGMIENKGREIGRSSASTITTTGWVRPGEDSKEYLLSMRALPGGGGNQLFYELTYVQAKSPSGGSRVDSGTSLFKGVAVFLTSAYFENIAALRKGKPSDNVLGEIESKDIFGLINPSNLKSFSLEHGGTLLREGKASIVLDALSEKEAAVAMLLAFGSNYIDTPDKGALSSALYEALREMPGVYKETALQIGLRQGPEVGGRELLSSLDKAWNPASMYSLMDITGEQMLSALSGAPGKSGGIKSALSELMSKGTKSSKYLNVDNAMERQAATILTALDITRQLMRNERVSPGDVSYRPDVMEQLMSIVGLSEAPEEELAQAMVRGLSQSVASVYLKMDLAYSSSKEPIGTKGTGALQNADLVRPFTQIAKEFTEGGDLSKLRVVLANMLVSTATTETATMMMSKLQGIEDVEIRSVFDPQLFTPLAMSRNLGIYGSGMEDITALKKLYKDYGAAVQTAIEERVTAIAGGVGDVRTLGSELSTLLFEASDLSSIDTQSLLGSMWRDEYSTSLSAIQDVGRRYELLATKAFGVGEAEAIASEMSHERGIYYLPAVVFDSMPSESGRIIARFDDVSPGTSFYLPSAEDLRTYGIQYGSYTDELVRSTLTLASAFSPGTAIGNIFSTLAKVKATGASSVEFTADEVKALQNYYVTAYGIVERIAEASTGTRLKMEARLRGFVGTFAATFGLPQGMFLAPEEGMRGAGDVRDSLRRQRLEEVTRSLSDPASRDSMRLLKAERDALMGGMGEKGSMLLRTVQGDVEYITRNPLLQKEYIAARLWTIQDANHVSALMETRSGIGVSQVQADRITQEIKDYTRSRVGTEDIPNLPGVRSYRDIVGAREGNEGNYYAVELGEQVLRSASGVWENSYERTVNPPALESWLRSKKVYEGSERRARLALDDQYVSSKDKPYRIDPYTSITPSLLIETTANELPPLGRLSRVLEQGVAFTGTYGDITLKKGTLTRLREAEGSVTSQLEYQRRQFDKAFNTSSRELRRVEGEYEYLQSKLYGYNREGSGLKEQVINLERMLETNGPLEYGRRKLDKAFNASKYALQSAEREYEYLKSKLYGYNREGAGLNEQVINLQRMLDTGGPLEYQRRQLDKAFNASKYALEKAERQYEYQQSKLHGYNREGAGLDEQVRNLERILDSGKTPFDYKERQYRYEVQAWEWELKRVSRAETNMQSQIKGISGAIYGKEVEVDREWAHWYSDASLESPMSHVEGTQEVMGRQLISLQNISGQVEWASQRIGIFSSISEDQFTNAEGVWGPYRTQERLRSTDSALKGRYESTIRGLDSELDIAFKRMDALPNNKTVQRGRLGRLIGDLVGTKKNIQGQVRLGSASTGYSWYGANDTLESLTESRDRLVGIQERIEGSLERTQVKTERLMGYLPSTEELEALSKRRMVAEDNLRIARDTLADPVLNEQRALWRAEKEEQLAQARTKKSDTESALKELGMDLVTLKESKVTRYEEYVEGLKKYEIEKPVWRAEKQEQLVQARTKQAEVQSRLYELRGDSLTGAGGELEALRIAKDTSYEEYIYGLNRYETEKPVWRAEKQGQLAQAHISVQETEDKLYELRGDSLTGAGGKLEALRAAKDRKYSEYEEGLRRYELEKQRASSYNEVGGTWFKRYSVGGDSQLRVSKSGDGNYYRKYETVGSSWTGKQRDKVTRLREIVERQQIAADASRRENAMREWEGLSSRTETMSSFMVGGEEYANREQAIAAGEKVVPNKNLIEQLGGAINADSMGQWQDSIRGRVETYRIDRSLFQGLGMGESRELLADSVERSKVSIDELLVSLERVDSAYGYDTPQKELIETSRTELRELSSALDTLHKGRGEWTSIEAPLARMESLQVSLNTSDVLQATVFRSAPFGSTELQRQQFTAVGLVKNLNVYLESQGMSQLDESRNKSLGLMPVMSGHALGLLDYDGDNFTVIFSKIGTAMNDRQRLTDRVKSNTLRQGMLRKQASSNGGEYLDEYWLASDEYRIANEEIGMRIRAIDAEMSSVRDTLVQTYDPLLRKEVSSYLGVSQAFMSEYQEKPISMEVLPTFLQQSRGLFGGIQGVAHDNSIMTLHATMESIHATEDFRSALSSLKQGASISEALSTSNIDTSVMLKDVSDNHFRELLTNNPSLRADVLDKMAASIQANPSQGIRVSLMEGAAQLSSSEVALSNYSKYMGMGSGASMSPTVYDMLTKTLGVAGGDILGKSYNALVGTLFRDSPLIALSHVLGGEGGSTVMDSMKEYYAGTTMADDIEGTFNQVHVEAKRAESLQAFMKSAQQLLRDSIKFKGDTDVLGDLQKAHGEYQKYIDQGDDASARVVLSEMAGKLGPGPGLRSYMQLGTLIETSSNNVYGKPLTGIDDSSIAFLSKEYKISSNEEITRLSNEMRDRGVDVSEGTIGDVVRYKVARDMRATITAFRYELGSQDNQPFLDTIWSGIRGFLGVGEDADRDEVMDRKFISDPSLKADIGAALSKDANEWWEEASSKNKALMLALVDEGRKQTDPIFGNVGEGLNQFVTLETLRKKAGKLGGGRAKTMSGISTELADTDITIALMNSSMNGIDPEAASHYMTVMKDFMGDSTGMEQVLGQTQGGRSFLELNSVGGVGVRVINKKDGGIRVGYHDEPLGEGESYRKLNVRNSAGEVVAEHNSPMGFLDVALEATSTGQRRRLLDNIGDAFNNQTMHSDQSWAGTISSALGASLPEAEVLSATISRLTQAKVSKGMAAQQASQEAIVEARDPLHQAETREIRGKAMGDASAPIISAALRAQAVTSNPSRAVLTGMNPGAQAASHARHSQEMHDAVGRMHDMNDMVLGAGLTLLGSLMATGSINENTIGQVVGGTVSMLGYSQMGRPGVASVLGQSFRARMAHAESKGSQDEGEWIRRWVGREVGFFMGAAVIAPAIMGGAERILSKFSPLRVDRPMDVDRYKGWKAASNTLGGAVLSSVLGMLTSVIGGEVAVHGTNLIPSLGIVENFVRSMSETESKRQDMIGERLAQVGEGTVMDDDGDPMRAAIEVSYVMDNPTTDFSAYPSGESDYSEGDDWEVNVVG